MYSCRYDRHCMTGVSRECCHACHVLMVCCQVLMLMLMLSRCCVPVVTVSRGWKLPLVQRWYVGGDEAGPRLRRWNILAARWVQPPCSASPPPLPHPHHQPLAPAHLHTSTPTPAEAHLHVITHVNTLDLTTTFRGIFTILEKAPSRAFLLAQCLN